MKTLITVTEIPMLAHGEVFFDRSGPGPIGLIGILANGDYYALSFVDSAENTLLDRDEARAWIIEKAKERTP